MHQNYLYLKKVKVVPHLTVLAVCFMFKYQLEEEIDRWSPQRCQELQKQYF